MEMHPSPARPRSSGSQLQPATGYDEAAESYDGWKWQQIWHKFEWPIILQKLPSRPPNRILDVGVGTGFYLKILSTLFPDAELHGVDISKRMLEIARRRLGRGARLYRGDATKMPIPEGAFDLVLLCRVATHVQNLTALLQEMSRVMTPGGLAIVTDVDPHHHYSCTAVPTKKGKIRIVTFKHSIDDWKFAARAAQLSLSRPKHIFSRSIARGIDFELPHSIDAFSNRPIGFVLKLHKRVENHGVVRRTDAA